MPNIKWLLLCRGCSNSFYTQDSITNVVALKSLGNKGHIKTPERISELLDAEDWIKDMNACLLSELVFNNSSLSIDEDVLFACDSISLEIVDSYYLFKYKYDHIPIEIEPEIGWQLNEY